jgi:hypothetical protein
MPRFCETCQKLYNIWTIEEKVAWVDAILAEGKFIEEATVRLAKHWNGRTPGYGEYMRALELQKRG